jgi:nitrogen-specific signal transduction histidine kinase
VVKVGFASKTRDTDIGSLEFDIFDNGPGVPSEIREKLFTPFATGKPEGVGLGLAVARQVARSHGGDITHFREEGWTRFHVRLARDPSTNSGQKMVGLDHV